MTDLKLGDSNPQDEPGVEAWYSGATAWMAPRAEVKNRPIELTLKYGAPGQIVADVIVRLGPEDPPCVGFDPKVLKGEFDAGYAVLKILCRDVAGLTPQGSVHGAFLCLLGGATVVGMTLEVSVSHAPVQTLANEIGPIDPGTSFLPLGAVPNQGSSFYLTYAEVQAKTLQNLTLHLLWQNLPLHAQQYPAGFVDYYREYAATLLRLHPDLGPRPFSSTEYRVAVDCKVGDSWQRLSSSALPGNAEGDDSLPLFQATPVNPATQASETALSFSFDQGSPTAGLHGGSIRVQLVQPSYAFGHALYPQVVADVALCNAQTLMQMPAGSVPALQPMPNPPLTPALSAVTVSYQASTAVSFEAEGMSARCHQLLPLITPRLLMRRNGVVMPLLTHAEGVAEIERCIRIILSTQPGTRAMEPEFGCALAGFLFRSIDATLEAMVESNVRAALLRYEPRIQVEDVMVDGSAAMEGGIDIGITYQVLATQSRHNIVYPYGQEGRLLPLP